MIVVPVILDSAITGRAHSLVTLTIANDGTGTATRGNYRWQLRGRSEPGKFGKVFKEGVLTNWPRKAKPVMRLIQAVLNKAYQ